MISKPQHVLFICSANMCRSPMAEGYLLQQIRNQGIDEIEVRSAALYYDDGYPATDGAQKIAKRYGFNLDGHRSQVLSDELFEWAEIIFVMTRDHRTHLLTAYDGLVGDKVHLLASHDPHREGLPDPEIADPYGSPNITYEDVFAQIKRSIDHWLHVRVAV